MNIKGGRNLALVFLYIGGIMIVDLKTKYQLASIFQWSVKTVEKHLTEMERNEFSKYILEPSQGLRRISLSGYYKYMEYKQEQRRKML